MRRPSTDTAAPNSRTVLTFQDHMTMQIKSAGRRRAPLMPGSHAASAHAPRERATLEQLHSELKGTLTQVTSLRAIEIGLRLCVRICGSV